jgi:signal transduction histidine kinase
VVNSIARLYTGTIGSKIIIPYIILTAIVAVMGTFVVTTLVAGTTRERFVNQLIEAGRVAGDSIVRREDRHLEVLRLMVFTEGVDQAVVNGDADALRGLLEGLAANADLDSVIATDTSGQVITRLDLDRSIPSAPVYRVSSGEDIGEWPIVAPVLAGVVDERGDKYAGLVTLPGGVIMLYTSGPVQTEEGDVVGAMLVGTTLDRLLTGIKTESLADIVVYQATGDPVSSTLAAWRESPQWETLRIAPERYQEVIAASYEPSVADLELFERPYAMTFVPMLIRGQVIGVMGVLLPSNFLIQAAAVSRLSLAAIFAMATLLVILIGYWVAQRIARPVRQLARITRLMMDGDLSQRILEVPADEIGDLAASFNQMSETLQQRTVALEQHTIALEEEAARIRAILSSIADGVFVRDMSGSIILRNQATRDMFEVGSRLEKDLLAAIDAEENGDSAVRPSQRVDMGKRVVSVRVAPVHTEEGEQVGEVVALRDVTTEAAAERLKDNFFNSISHELRTPLGAIKGYTDILLHGGERLSESARDRAMHNILDHTLTLERMIRQLIDLSEMVAGSLYLQRAPAELNQLVRETMVEWQPRFLEVGILARYHDQVDPVMVNIDSRRLRWAIDALLDNACRYSPDGGKVDILLEREEDVIIMQIKDTGVGISPQDMLNIFLRFYRGTPVRKDKQPIDVRGAGQGLYIVKSVVEAHGGRVWAESEVGKGSTFSILLPLVSENH